MRLILPSYEIYEQASGLEGIYEAIERAGRTCYKSKAKYQYRDVETGEVVNDVPEDMDEYVKYCPPMTMSRTKVIVHGKERILKKESVTAKGFVDRMIASQHYAMLEHGTVYLMIPYTGDVIRSKYYHNPYSRVNHHSTGYNEGFIDVTTNYRVLVENDWLEDLKYLCEPTEHHEKRVTVRFTSNIHFYKDITRHRRMSFAIESTRYCNYNRGKFDNQLTFIIPVWSNIPEWNESEANKIYSDLPKDTYEKQWDAWYNYTFGGLLDKVNYYEARFLQGLRGVEETYIDLTTDDPKLPGHWQAQQAAEILPQATKADIVMTGFVSDWNYVFDLRARGTTGAPHPEVKRLMEPLMHEFEEKKWIKEQ